MPCGFLSAEETAKIEEARRIAAQADELEEQINDLLDPIAKRVSSLTDEEILAVVNILPRGFYRSELRTLVNERTLKAK